MQNDEGENVDLYVPRKCSATNRLITPKDHASIQVNIANVDGNGRYNGEYTTFAICGLVRSRGESDASLVRLSKSSGVLEDVYAASRKQ